MYFKHIEQKRETFDQYCERLANESMSIQQRQRALQELFQITQARELLPARTQNRLELVEQSLDREMRHYGDNAYGFLQGITHYTSNVMQTRERQLIPTTNAAAELNNRAFNYLISNFINN
jgi:DNA-binding transcriptional regulator YbjK